VNPETNPYIPAAGSRPPVLAGREDELDTFTVALGRLGKGVHARSMILDGVRGVGKTVLLREFNYIAREQGWITSGVVECDEGERLPRIVAKLCHRALRDLDKRWSAGEAIRRAFGVLKAFTLTLGGDGHWRFNIDFDAVKGVADSGDPEVDIVELLGESVRRDGLLKKGLVYSRVDTQLDFTVPQFAAFIERIHPFDAAQRPRRGRPPR
jgi:AAA ATPase domain